MKAQHVRARRILSLCCIAAGVILLLYPQIREWAGRYEVESQAEAYQGRMEQETDGRLREMWDSAERYNRELSRGAAVLTDPFLSEVRQQEQEYESLLAAGGDGLMGFVEIGTIDVYLPIYHGRMKKRWKRERDILKAPPCRWEGRGRIRYFPGTPACARRSCLQIWTS